MTCPHAPSGCNYPEAECAGVCAGAELASLRAHVSTLRQRVIDGNTDGLDPETARLAAEVAATTPESDRAPSPDWSKQFARLMADDTEGGQP